MEMRSTREIKFFKLKKKKASGLRDHLQQIDHHSMRCTREWQHWPIRMHVWVDHGPSSGIQHAVSVIILVLQQDNLCTAQN